MAFRDEIDSLRQKIAELERTLAARDARLAELEAALRAEEIGERHRVRVRQLEAAIRVARQDAARARVLIAEQARARRA